MILYRLRAVSEPLAVEEARGMLSLGTSLRWSSWQSSGEPPPVICGATAAIWANDVGCNLMTDDNERQPALCKVAREGEGLLSRYGPEGGVE